MTLAERARIAAAFAADGFAIVPEFARPRAIAEVRARAEAIVASVDPGASRSVFSTRGDAAARDDYFLGSGDRVRCFFEPEALDETGALRVPLERAINKIGHALHDRDPVFDRFSHSSELDEVARAVGLAQPQVYQSMYIFKQPHIGGEVGWHQDATFFATDPHTVTTFWFALERADRDNGCLWVEPGGHRSPLRERFVRSGGSVAMEPLDATPWPRLETARPLEVDAGTLVVFHGLLPHYSAPNRSTVSRHAYTLHAVDARATYAPENWLQRDASLPVRGFVRAAAFRHS